MSNDSTNTAFYSSSNENNQTLRLSMDSKKNNQTSHGYLTRSKKSNLVFSIVRVEKHLREGGYAESIDRSASIYLTSVLEYLCLEILELAGEMTHRSNRKRITPRDITLAIKDDHELARLCADVTIPDGGVPPFIHQVLLKTKQRRRKRRVRFNEENIDNTSSKQSTGDNSDSTDTDAYTSSDSDDSDVLME